MEFHDTIDDAEWRTGRNSLAELKGFADKSRIAWNFARGSPYSRLVLIRRDSYLLISIRFSGGGLSLVRRPPHSSRVLSSPPFCPFFARQPFRPFALRPSSYRLVSGRLVFLRENIFGEPGVPSTDAAGTRPSSRDHVYDVASRHFLHESSFRLWREPRCSVNREIWASTRFFVDTIQNAMQEFLARDRDILRCLLLELLIFFWRWKG